MHSLQILPTGKLPPPENISWGSTEFNTEANNVSHDTPIYVKLNQHDRIWYLNHEITISSNRTCLTCTINAMNYEVCSYSLHPSIAAHATCTVEILISNHEAINLLQLMIKTKTIYTGTPWHLHDVVHPNLSSWNIRVSFYSNTLDPRFVHLHIDDVWESG